MFYSSLLIGLLRILPPTEKQEIIDYLQGKYESKSVAKKMQEKEKAMVNEICKGNGEWWKSIFPQERAYMQYYCSMQILPVKLYLSDIEQLLGRKVNPIKVLNTDKYELEINIKFKRWIKNVVEDY